MKDTIVAGDTLDFVTSVPDYPASAGYTLKYRLVPRTSGTAILLTAATSGVDDYRVTVAPATSAGWTSGEYSAFAWVEKSGERHTVDPGLVDEQGNSSLLVRILPDPSAVAAYDGRSTARKALDDALTALATFHATNGLVRSYSINGRSMEFKDERDIRSRVNYWQAKVDSEEATTLLSQGLPGRPKLQVVL